jgi:hypothetical protein
MVNKSVSESKFTKVLNVGKQIYRVSERVNKISKHLSSRVAIKVVMNQFASTK